MQASAVLNCQFSKWFPIFGHLGFKSKIISLSQEFTDFLIEDGVFLSEFSSALPRRALPDAFDDDYREWEEEEEPHQTEEDMSHQMPAFPNLRAEIDAGIAELGGRVAPKFSWSSPHDATWVSADHSLGCSSADEVLLLLKSSDRVMHDICDAFAGCPAVPGTPIAHTLALRRWVLLKPQRELRCFVRQRDLIAMSQRNMLESPDELQAKEDELRELLLEFFEQHILEHFPEADYTFDVYVTTAGKVRLLDFNPIGGTTSPLLFTWEELGYCMTPDPTASEPRAVPAEPCPAGTAARLATDGSHLAADAPATVREGSTGRLPSTAQLLDRYEVSDAGDPRSDGQQDRERASNGICSVRVTGCGPDNSAAVAPGTSGQQEIGRGSTSNGRAHASGSEQTEIMLRFSQPGSNMLRPASALYGAPYDMADLSEGGAINDMLRRMQTQHEHNDD